MTKEEKEEKEIVKKLLEEHPISEMVKFSEIDLYEKIEKNPYWIVKYREHYYNEVAKLEELEDIKEKILGKRYDYYRFEIDKNLSKPEIEKYYLPKDEKVLQIKKIIRRQKVRVRFFEMAYKVFEKMQWSMKNYIDVLKGNF